MSDKFMAEEGNALRVRFDALKATQGISRAAFARMYNVPGGGSMIYQHINALKPIGMDAALAYVKGFGCELEEISDRLANEAKKLTAITGTHSVSYVLDANVEPALDLTGKVPLISWVQAGLFCNAPDLLQPGDAEDWIPTPRKYGPHAYALRVVGDSMVSPNPAQASYHPGLLIIVDPDRAITNGSRVVARISGTEEATFKVYSEDAGQRYLKPLNPQYPTIPMTEDMVICGVVVGSWRDE